MSLRLHKFDYLSKQEESSAPFSDGYSILFEPGEAFQVESKTEGKLVVIGMRTAVWSSRRERHSYLANQPLSLIVRRENAKGTLTKPHYVWQLESKSESKRYSLVDSTIAAEFRKKFYAGGFNCYHIYDRHQIDIAQENAKQFGGYGWTAAMIPDVVCRWMDRNKYFQGLLHAEKVSLEERLREARNHNMQLRGDWYKDDDMSAKFDALMAPHPIKESGDVKEKLRALNDKMTSVKGEVMNSHRFEDMSFEVKQYRALEKEFWSLFNANIDSIGRTGIGSFDMSFLNKPSPF